ncbi:DUF3809 domain-containing protein [Deinococcus fonticola]|uniref:DUF3809 domain-containing protein n=1 Tax=Deinococcus fonticola TaxID=2528713 RepID=UPI0010749F73|nr:DUF3809 domain-containing protein [Deinococcus fonticola]
MILESAQTFTLKHPRGFDEALRFVRSPEVSLARVRFLSDLTNRDGQVGGHLTVKTPGLGDIYLPFASQLQQEPDGASLQALTLPDRNWVAVDGRASVIPTADMTFRFHFTAHVTLPDVPGWGSAAFEKMVSAAAQRTLMRVAEALPRDLEAALPTPE